MLHRCLRRITPKATRAEIKYAFGTKLSECAKPFASDQDSLMNGPLDEIISRETKMVQVLTQVRAMREDLEREHTSVDGQCTTYREKAIQGRHRPTENRGA